MPLDVAVVTPTKSRLALLKEAMDSVRAQTLTAWEHVIVDDGSDDGTAEEVARRAEQDPRVRYIPRTATASGANVCRNLGIQQTTAEFVVFLDSDDLLSSECLARRVEIMRRNPDLDFATFQFAPFMKTPDDHGRRADLDVLGDDLLRFLFFECPWIITGPIWRRTALLRLGLFDETLLSWQDVDLHIRAIASGCRYVRFKEVDHYIRWQFEETKVSVQQRRSPQHLTAALAILDKFERIVRNGPGMTWARQRALCSLYFIVAEGWVTSGHVRRGLDVWGEIRRRRVGPRVLYATGAAILVMYAAGGPAQRLGARIGHKWKGWMRLRTHPELVG